jgi:CheY-like chemotaxis protein
LHSLAARRLAGKAPVSLLSGQADDIEFIEEPEEEERSSEQPGERWVILVVDDDPDVHEATLLALGGERIHGRPLALLHAHSARQAREALAGHPDIDLLLLDVVMETADAGLVLARAIRQELGLQQVKIVIRTGHPGLFSEHAVRDIPEVDGYLTKSGVLRSLLIDTITELLSPRTAR